MTKCKRKRGKRKSMSDIDTVPGTVKLKVMAKTLAAEARFIREMEKRKIKQARDLLGIRSLKHSEGQARPIELDPIPIRNEEKRDEYAQKHYEEFWGLHRHRTLHLRREARLTHLARNFLNGRQYLEVEEKVTGELPDVDDLIKKIIHFSDLTAKANDEDRSLLRDNIIAWLGYVQVPNTAGKLKWHRPETIH
jgi:hypothetical protein